MKSKRSAIRAAAQRAASYWIRKCDRDDERGMNLPIPTQIISNEEFIPPAQTAEQRRVEHHLLAMAGANAKRLGMSRRRFLATTGGMATAFVALNTVFGDFFAVTASEMLEPAAHAERWPKNQFIFDVQTHHVEVGKQIPFLLGYRRVAGDLWNPDLRGREHRMQDLYLANYIKEIFLDSDTLIAVITGLPSPNEAENILPPAEMIETRAEINGLARSRRIVAHGLITPGNGTLNLEDMQRQKERLRVEAWKGYPGQSFGPGHQGWWMDDERVAYPAYEYSRRVGVKNICVHKGLPLPGWNVERSSPRDIPKAAADFPDLNFLIYHAAFQGMREGMQAMRALQENSNTRPNIPWITELCEARRRNPRLRNVYMELGTTFGMMAITHPEMCAHALAQMLEAFGPDHILWGTDSIWWGSPQWQIEAFRRFQIPEEMQRRFGYRPLTAEIKNRIFGLNGARVYGIDVQARLQAIPHDYMSKLRERYRAEGAQPSNTQYGWVARRA